ncbi:MAG TPA: acyl carrier protein [Longimicrobium sp.]|nr:acyl carrier protein [Longimicrobium sp.]
MSQDEIREAVLRALRRIAPEVGVDDIDPAESLRDQVDLDSMDFLNFVVGLGKDLGIEVPEADYPRLATLDGCVAYLAGKTAQPA